MNSESYSNLNIQYIRFSFTTGNIYSQQGHDKEYRLKDPLEHISQESK